ncbi:ferritin family protein [Thermococcus celer]|uniref:Rubrerythrin n=1 Tax=Thermococcus celer Vu 13 = JCM 8558 TaxID=1293037 RepID=A0A218P2N6_THECE|nr:hypothetical protein [Thermococcus celer]ASI99182.1 hypothetical protein A3L02_06195 [Thermococcus celer Vu 13 = JCM 8558]
MPAPLEAFMNDDAFEEIKAVLSDVSRRPFPEVLSYLIRSEEYSVGIYILLENTLPRSYWGVKFRDFVEKKLREGEKLWRVVRKLYPNLESEGETREWSRTFLNRRFELKTVGDYLAVLEVVMELEKLGERVYSYLAGRLSGEEKHLMMDLAKLSRDNYEALKREYDRVRSIKSDTLFKDFARELKGDEDGS